MFNSRAIVCASSVLRKRAGVPLCSAIPTIELQVLLPVIATEGPPPGNLSITHWPSPTPNVIVFPLQPIMTDVDNSWLIRVVLSAPVQSCPPELPQKP